MQLTMTDLQMEQRKLKSWTGIVIGGSLREKGGSANELTRELGWSSKKVEAFLSYEILAATEGRIVVSVTMEDFLGKSPLRAQHAVENALIRGLMLSLNPENCNRMIARMLGVGEWQIRRIRSRAGLPSASELRAERKRRESEKLAA